MKKRIKALILIVFVLVGMLGTITVQADQYLCAGHFNSVRSASVIYENANFRWESYSTINDISTDRFSLIVLLHKNGFNFYVYSDEEFTLNCDIVSSSYKVEDGSLFNSNDSSGVDATVKNYNRIYYASIGGSSMGTTMKYEDYWNNFQCGAPYINNVFDTGSDMIKNFIDDYVWQNKPFTEIDGYIVPDTFDESTATYDSSLGYLKNLKAYGLYDNAFDESNDVLFPADGNGSLKFVWDSTSTTGVDLSDENIYIRFYTSAGAVGATTNTPDKQLITNSERNYYKNFPAGACSILMTLNEFFSISDSDFNAWYDAQSFFDKYSKGYVRRDTAYLQLVRENEDGSWTYGGYVKVSFGRDRDSIDADSYTPDGEEDTSSPTNGDVPFISGSGDDVDDALQDALEKEDVSADSFFANWDDIGDVLSNFVQGLSSIQNSIGNFPSVVSSVLSYLPPELIWAIGGGISMAIVLRLLGR